jgi:hypothetical protein
MVECAGRQTPDHRSHWPLRIGVLGAAGTLVVALDAATTYVLVARIPGGYESNPAVAGLIGVVGLPLAMLLRFLVGATVFMAADAAENSRARPGLRLTVTITATVTGIALLLVVLHNLVLIGAS